MKGLRKARSNRQGVLLANQFNSRQVTAIVVAMALAVVLVPLGAWAGNAFPQVFVTDPVNQANKARVDGTGALQVAGNLNVANTPTVKAQQDGTWNVGITGTPNVNVGNFPSTQNVNVTGGSVSSRVPAASTSESAGFTVGAGDLEGRDVTPINASLITVTGVGDDEVLISFYSNGVEVFSLGDFDDSFDANVSVPLSQPIRVDHLFIQCENELEDCGLFIVYLVGDLA